MKAARILRFGPPSVITEDDLPQPKPAREQLLVRVKAAGVGNWDALIREGKVQLQLLPLTLGSELAGIVEGIGADVLGFELWRRVYGVTNEQFIMIKDDKGHYPGNPLWGDGWGWALFKPDAPDEQVATNYKKDCLDCHAPAQSTDWVWVQGYPVLKPE